MGRDFRDFRDADRRPAPRPYSGGRLSPDGTRIAIVIAKEGWFAQSQGDIWIGDLGGNFLPLTTDGLNQSPVWSPHGDQVAFQGIRDGKYSAVIQPAAGRSPAVPLTTSLTETGPDSWLPDGRTLIITERNAQTGADETKVVTVGRPEAPRLLLPTPVVKGDVMASPDGRWVAYTSAVSGHAEVYVTRLPTPGQIWPESQGGGGGHPVWARSSQELFFRGLDGRVMAVKVGANGPVPGAPRPVSLGDVALFDTFPDGRFLVAKTVSDRQLTRPLVVVLHWTSALTRK